MYEAEILCETEATRMTSVMFFYYLFFSTVLKRIVNSIKII